MIDYKKELALSSNHSPFSLERGWGKALGQGYSFMS